MTVLSELGRQLFAASDTWIALGDRVVAWAVVFGAVWTIGRIW